MAKHFLSYFTSQKLEEAYSSFNGKIEVSEFLGKPRIIIDGLLQSGGLIGSIWEKGIKRAKTLKLNAKNILLLGLGGGTAAKLINEYFPQAKTLGVEIDPIMIKLGKKYFGLEEIKNLKVINEDAIEFCLKTKRNKFNLILVDLYNGDKFPISAETTAFLRSLKKLISWNGLLIFNRLFYGKHRKLAEEFVGKLEQIFLKIELLRAWSNLLVVCEA